MKNSKILVCVDGSKCSDKAFSYAITLAEKFNSKLVAIYVVDKAIDLGVFDRKEYLSLLRSYGKRVLKKCSTNMIGKKIKFNTTLEEGRITMEITKYAKKGKFDLIVVGKKGLGRIPGFFMGSISNRVVKGAGCSVLVVK